MAEPRSGTLFGIPWVEDPRLEPREGRFFQPLPPIDEQALFSFLEEMPIRLECRRGGDSADPDDYIIKVGPADHG